MISNGGYPMKMMFEVENEITLRFIINLDYGLDSQILSELKTSWRELIKLFMTQKESNNFISTSKRNLQSIQN